MKFITEAFEHLFHKRVYIAFFYIVACLLLSTLATYAHTRLGLSSPDILLIGTMAIMPLNLAVYGLVRASKGTFRRLTRGVIGWLIRRSGKVLSLKRQKQILFRICGVALVIGTVGIATAVSSFVSFVSVRGGGVEPFTAMFVFTFLLELIVMLAVAFVPLAVFRLFSRAADHEDIEELSGYQERLAHMLVNVAEEQNYEQVNGDLVFRVGAGGG